MNLHRVIRHLFTGRAAARRAFPSRALDAIEQVIRETEATHQGQVRFAVEASLDLSPLFAGQTARQRALEVFSQLRVWDTEHNNGVLIYLLLADRNVEIVADRGIDAKLGQAAWETICAEMEVAFRAGEFERGVIAGVRSISAMLAQHYPHNGVKSNELSDCPIIL
ncbi:MAG: TPM domain-containing protein [Gallionellaceae bacterium]|nr:TPM domain-containing protein [Gallionellaceae bacterium]